MSSKIGKGVCQGCVLSPCLFNLYAEYIKWNARGVKHKLEKTAKRNNNKLRYADETTLKAKWRGTNSLLKKAEKLV